MASKTVLTEAINKLIKSNMALRAKISESADEAAKKEWAKEITRNESMILDYRFRLQNGDE